MISPEYESFKRRVKDASEIVRVVSGYIPLQRKGRNFWACCPFHQEKTPSFSVNPEGFFKCFGCGKGGDVFSFVMAVERVEFPEALELLAERAGIPVPERGGSPEEARLWEAGKKLLYRLNEFAAKFFEGQLAGPAGAAAREYLERRGISRESAAAFRLGCAPDSWDALSQELLRRRAEPRHIVAAGLALERKDGTGIYDRFRNRLTFPIVDLAGRCVGFGARAMVDTDNPKYLNSPETPIFHKGEMLFGLPQARESIEGRRRVLIMEGYTDVIMAAQKGFPAAVATLGTALGPAHLRHLRRFADQVLLVYDSDEAGLSAAERGLDIFFEEELPARIVTLAPGLDPCDFLVEKGPEAFAERLDASVDLFDFKLSAVRAKHDLATAHGRSAAVKELVETVGRASDPIMAAELRRRAAEAFGLPEDALAAELGARAARKGNRSVGLVGSDGSDMSDKSTLTRRQAAERALARALLVCPAMFPEAARELDFAAFADPAAGDLLRVARRVHDDLGELNAEALAAQLTRPEAAELRAEIAALDERAPLADPEEGVRRVLLDLRRIALEDRAATLREELRGADAGRQVVIAAEVVRIRRELEVLRDGPAAAAGKMGG